MRRRPQPACEPGALKAEQDILKSEPVEPDIKAEALNVLSEPLLKRKAEALDASTASSDQSAAFLDLLRPTPQECLVWCWFLLFLSDWLTALTSI